MACFPPLAKGADITSPCAYDLSPSHNDGQTPVVVDPTTVNARMATVAPYVKPANTPNRNLSWCLFFPGAASAGATASVDFKANNVFTAP
jgi:hypothetical protein